MTDLALIESFKTNPEWAYRELLSQYSAILLRMIRYFMKDPDEVMEVYTEICERLGSNNFQALGRLRSETELKPWLSVIVANACRDRFRKKKARSVPMSVISKLDAVEKLVFKYHFQENLVHEDIAEIISIRHKVNFSALEVVHTIGKINELLSTRKRWFLLSALNANKGVVSLDALEENGFSLSDTDESESMEEILRHKETLDELNRALQLLTPDDHLLITLRFEHDRTAPDIAKVMGYENPKYVYTRLRTVIGQLQRHMGLV